MGFATVWWFQCSNIEDFEYVKMETTKLLKSIVGKSTVSLPSHFIGQTKSQGQPTFEWKNKKSDSSLVERSGEFSFQKACSMKAITMIIFRNDL